jgi:hypothetical protein
MKACFADNAELPIECVNDLDKPWDCLFANQGVKKEQCIYWQPERTKLLVKDILGE